MTDTPSILSHVSLGTNQFEAAITFYDAVLATLGYHRLESWPEAVAYGKQFPEFWIQKPINEQPASVGNGTHIGFIAISQAQVQQFYATALAVGGIGEGEPGPRPHYGAPYYGCFVRDLDGHKIEAAFWDINLE